LLFIDFFTRGKKNVSLSINRNGVAHLIEKCAKNEGSDIGQKTLSPYAACNKIFFIFFRFFRQGVAQMIEKYAKKCISA
jgi:hypothetical protein